MATPAPPASERTLRAVGARRARPEEPSAEELVQRLRAASGEEEALVALFDAEAIAGERHLFSAWAHLGRSRREGAKRLRDRGAELALYVAGDDQLGRALGKVGIRASTASFVLVAEKPRSMTDLFSRFGLEADPTAYPRAVGPELLDRLGISPEERSSVPRDAWEGLVLERVALVDLSSSAPHGAARGEGPRARRGKR